MVKYPVVVDIPNPDVRKLYFNNNHVEDLMLRYKWTGCTDVKLRDDIMKNTEELIRQVIRAHNLHKIYPGQEESAFMDLFQIAWVQIEKTLYKYKALIHCGHCYNSVRPLISCIYRPEELEYDILTPEDIISSNLICRNKRCQSYSQVPKELVYRGTSKIFNMWSQVARTVILAYIKKESRDHKNSEAYRNHIDSKYNPDSESLMDFIKEARQICRHNQMYLTILDALENISMSDDKPYDGIINKLVMRSGLPKIQVVNFLKMVRLRSDEFSFGNQSAGKIKNTERYTND